MSKKSNRKKAYWDLLGLFLGHVSGNQGKISTRMAHNSNYFARQQEQIEEQVKELSDENDHNFENLHHSCHQTKKPNMCQYPKPPHPEEKKTIIVHLRSR